MDTPATILCDITPDGATAAVGAWVRGGAAIEPTSLAGITHMIEHLLLRRCGARGPRAIAELTDSLGGDVDAFTTHEGCAVTAHVAVEQLAEATDLVLDAVFRPCFEAEDVDLERRVIQAEFDLVDDSPSEVAAERALEACWGDHPLARPVLGQREIVERLRPRQLAAYHRRHFVASELVLVVVAPSDVRADLESRCAALPRGAVRPQTAVAPRWHRGVVTDIRDGLEQVYANLVLPGLPVGDAEQVTLGVLDQILGGGSSSRLFAEVRDRLALVYEIGTSIYSARTAGVLEVAFSAPLRNVEVCWDTVLAVLDKVGREGCSDREVALARQALTAGVVLGTEGSDAMMEAHAGEWIARGRRFDRTAICREIAAVTPERVRDLAQRLIRLDTLAGAVCGSEAGIRLPAGLERRTA